jgi:hypothetical protein
VFSDNHLGYVCICLYYYGGGASYSGDYLYYGACLLRPTAPACYGLRRLPATAYA